MGNTFLSLRREGEKEWRNGKGEGGRGKGEGEGNGESKKWERMKREMGRKMRERRGSRKEDGIGRKGNEEENGKEAGRRGDLTITKFVKSIVCNMRRILRPYSTSI